MKNFLCLACFAVAATTSLGQIAYEKGYIVDRNSQRVECLIRNLNWTIAPDGIDYRLSADGEVHRATPVDILEFGIGEEIKYRAFWASVDLSIGVSNQKMPSMVSKAIFAKVLVEGTATLYEYSANVFLFSLKDGRPSQLVFRYYEYVDTRTGELTRGSNKSYQQQLFNDVNCQKHEGEAFKRISYNRTSLVNHFEKFNECSDPSYHSTQKEAKPKQSRIATMFRVTPGLDFTKLAVRGQRPDQMITYGTYAYGRKINPRLGLEIEFVWKTLGGKWGFVVEPTFQQYSSKILYEHGGNGNPTTIEKSSIDYSSIDLPIGFRYRTFLAKEVKLFLNGFVVMELATLQNDLKFATTSVDLDSHLHFAGGGGLSIKQFSLELRHSFPRDISFNTGWKSEYVKNSFVFGWLIPNKRGSNKSSSKK